MGLDLVTTTHLINLLSPQGGWKIEVIVEDLDRDCCSCSTENDSELHRSIGRTLDEIGVPSGSVCVQGRLEERGSLMESLNNVKSERVSMFTP